MTIRYCTRCRKPYGEALEGVVNAAGSYAPFCSKRCADVDLVHWLKGEYVIGGSGELMISEDGDDEGGPSVASEPPGADDDDA